MKTRLWRLDFLPSQKTEYCSGLYIIKKDFPNETRFLIAEAYYNI